MGGILIVLVWLVSNVAHPLDAAGEDVQFLMGEGVGTIPEDNGDFIINMVGGPVLDVLQQGVHLPWENLSVGTTQRALHFIEGPGITVSPDLALETFEGAFPEPFWFVGDLNPADGEVFWDRVPCGGPFEGSFHAWSAGVGGVQPCVAYLSNMDAIMFVEATYSGRSFADTDFISLAVKQQIASGADFGYIYVQGYTTPPPHGERGSPIAEGFCIFNDIPGDCVTPTDISPYQVLPIRLGPAFDSANFVRVIIGFHSDGSGVAGGTFVDNIDFHQSPGHQIFPIAGGFPRVLSVSVTGSGTVTSTPAGISCPPDCSEAYLRGTPVTLTATPAEGWTFAGWGGACTGTGPCTVVMDTDQTVTATFTRVETFVLSVTVLGDGVVTSTPAGISCPPDCSEAYLRGTPVTLTATPAEGWTFAGWGGACEGQGNPCSLIMEADQTVTAFFALPGPDLTGRLGFFPICPPKSLDVLVFTAHISNIGSEATASPFTVKFFLSDDDLLVEEEDLLLLAKDVMESIPPGGTRSVSGFAKVERPFLDKFIIVKIDFPDDVNQENNIIPQRIPCP